MSGLSSGPLNTHVHLHTHTCTCVHTYTHMLAGVNMHICSVGGRVEEGGGVAGGLGAEGPAAGALLG